MNKKNTTVAIVCAFALTIPMALSGCQADSFANVTLARQDTTYAVESQGGNSVSYGNYVYFINGYRGYADEDGKQNLYGNVVKGGLYRAELNGSKVAYKDMYGTEVDGVYSFAPTLDQEAGLEFKYSIGKDYDENDINVVDVTPVANKTVGTDGYTNGGLFIYDDYIFYASPNNEMNNVGTVQVTRTDFYMQNLSGGKPKKIYTAAAGTNAAAYAFYKFGNSVYLNVFESPNIVSVKITGTKVEERRVLCEDATSVLFPTRDTYYKGIDNNTPADFIYYVRAANSADNEDHIRSGTVIECMRPDGSEHFLVRSSQNTLTLESADDGMLFYREAVSGTATTTTLRYTNMHNQLIEYSDTYKAKYDEDAKADINGHFSSVYMDGLDQTFAYSISSGNGVRLVTVDNDASITMYDPSARLKTVYTGTAYVAFIRDGKIFYSDAAVSTSSSETEINYFTVELEARAQTSDDAMEIASNITGTGLPCDYTAGYFVYYGYLDEWADDYTYFKLLDRTEGIDPYFVGIRAEADIYDEDEDTDSTSESE